MIREQTWHTRIPNAEHHRFFRNIVGIHAMTRGWLSDMEKGQHRQTHILPRVQAQGIDENLWMLEKLSETYAPGDLVSLLDDRMPAELLKKFERTVWIVHAWTLAELRKQTPEEEMPALMNLLEQSSWKAGRACSQERWSELPAASRERMNSILTALMDSPLNPRPDAAPFLIRRTTETESCFEMLACPHKSPFPEVRSVAADLCRMQFHWVRGFVYAINTRVLMEYQPAQNSEPRCSQRWMIPPHPLA